MFNIGDTVIYGTTGVCNIIDITKLSGMQEADRDRLYYVIKPVYLNETIYSPVDSEKIFIRPVISKDEALRLIDLIPSIGAEAYSNYSLQYLDEHYRELLYSHDCSDLLELTMSIYMKKKYIEQQKRRFGLIDEQYFKRAEELLFGELAAALGIPREDVQCYIARRVEESKSLDA